MSTNTTESLLLALALGLGYVVVIVVVGRAAHHAQTDPQTGDWSALAKRTGLPQLDRFELAGVAPGAPGLRVHVDGRTRQSPGKSVYHATRIAVSLQGTAPKLYLQSRRRAVFAPSDWPRRTLGDRAFDRRVVVAGDDQATRRLADPVVREAVRAGIQAGWKFEGGAWHLELGGRASALDREIARGIALAALLAKAA